MEKIIDVKGVCPKCGRTFHYDWNWDYQECQQCVNAEVLNEIKWFFINTGIVIGLFLLYLWLR